MQYDVIIIGSGPGGYVAAIRASQLGLKTAVVERAELGGICLNWGCIPTKALIKSAQVFEYIEHAKDYGIEVGKPSSDWTAMVKRSRDVAAGMNKGVQFLLRKNKVDVLVGHGKVLGGGRVEVSAGGQATTYDAKHVILATGSRARALPNLPIDGEKVIEYRRAMTLPQQPKSMVVVGAGAIGTEFAYVYGSTGTAVTVVEYMEAGLVPREDADVSKELGKIYKRKGIEVLANTSVERVDTTGEQIVVHLKDRKTDKETTLSCDVVLSAAGVAPNTENLGLAEVGVKTERGLVVIDEFYRTNVEGIYAIGDITPGPALAHVASAEGIICVERIAGQDAAPLDYDNIPGCTYCVPEVASVGHTEASAREAGYELRVGKFPFSASGKASAAGAKEGFVKVIFDKKYGEFLGAHMLGANVTEMIAEVVVARKLETTGHEMIKSVHPHPTMSEAIMEATAAAYDEVIHL